MSDETASVAIISSDAATDSAEETSADVPALYVCETSCKFDFFHVIKRKQGHSKGGPRRPKLSLVRPAVR